MTRYAVAILLALTMRANAADPANLILPGCKVFLSATTPMEHLSAGRCMGIVEGIAFMGFTEHFFCPPKDVTSGQALTVVIRYIEARPERMHEEFQKLVLEALTAAWPCKR
jgi:hypothetical protein